MKKTYFLLLAFFYLNGLIFAQCDPPSHVMMKKKFLPGYPPTASIEWDLDQTGLIDHYEVYLDGEEFIDIYGVFAYGYCGFSYYEGLPEPLEVDVYHDAGVLAVDINGQSSDTVSFHFYFSSTAYMRPTGLNVLNDLEAGTAFFTWNEPPFGGGQEEPSVTGYSVFLDGNHVAETSDPQYTFTGLSIGVNYVAGLVTHYSDGNYDTTFYQNNAKTEFYFDELTAPVNLAVDESTGIFNWSKPNMDGEVIGGTFFRYPLSIIWEFVWFNEEEHYTTFGDETHFVNTRWDLDGWVHNHPKNREKESVWFSNQGYDANYALAGNNIMQISEIYETAGLAWDSQANAYDANTHGGVGDFTVHHNEGNGHYGVARLDSVYYVNPDMELWGLDLTWWVQTNGTDDFSSAYNYYPYYYLIYLDDELIDTVQPGYEQQLESTYGYQFENLVDGQSYTAGIVAVYNVGKSEMVTIEFSPTVGIKENAKGSSSLNIYPNPVTSQAHISYTVPEEGTVTIEILDVMGKKVKTLLSKNVTTGEYQICWDCRNDNGVKLVPGIYLCTLKTAHHTSTYRILVK